LHLHRAGIGFYTLRHVFRTVADAARDPVAIDLIMGHSDPSMGAHYRQRVEDDRLRAVADHVRRWLFGENPDEGAPKPEKKTPNTSDTSTLRGPAHEARGASRSEGAQGPATNTPGPSGNARPTLRLYVG